MTPLRVIRRVVLTATLAAWTPAGAQATFRVSQIFSNLDGSIQFIALTETAGLDGQNHFKGLPLTVTRAGVAKQFTFDVDLAVDKTAHLSVIVAATPGGPIVEVMGHDFVFSYPDFIVPARFVAAGGGTVDFAGIDAVTYPALPHDGSTAWYRDGTLAPAKVPGAHGCVLIPSSGCQGEIDPTPTRVAAVEYYNAALDHYFITASADEIDALDAGRTAGWERTGEAIAIGQAVRTPLDLEYVYDTGITQLEYEYYGGPVCRFYLPPGQGDSHFFSASPAECAAVGARFPSFIEETTAAFYAATPDPATGQCGAIPGFIDDGFTMLPVYRLWNQRADSNHRYTTRPEIRDAMIARGWLSEGYGPQGVVMCI